MAPNWHEATAILLNFPAFTYETKLATHFFLCPAGAVSRLAGDNNIDKFSREAR